MMMVLSGLVWSVYRHQTRKAQGSSALPHGTSAHAADYLRYLVQSSEQRRVIASASTAGGTGVGSGGSGSGAVQAPPGPAELLEALEQFRASTKSSGPAPAGEGELSPPTAATSTTGGMPDRTIDSTGEGASRELSAGAPEQDMVPLLPGSVGAPAVEDPDVVVAFASQALQESNSFADLRGTATRLPDGVLLVGEGQLTAVPGMAPEAGEATSAAGGGRSLVIGVGASRGVFRPPGPPAGLTEAEKPKAKRPLRLRLRGLAYLPRGRDIWTRWPDANTRNITGAVGTERLNQAFEILANSQAKPVADDLYRKGIAVGFGEAKDFEGRHVTNAATLIYSTTDHPSAGAPSQPPAIKFHPRLREEDPRVLATVLAHEGTHVQQYLDGTLLELTEGELDVEMAAWINAAGVWQQLRGSAAGLDSPLAREAELAYQVARWGDMALRDLLAALYGPSR